MTLAEGTVGSTVTADDWQGALSSFVCNWFIPMMAKRSGFQIQKLSQGHALLLLHFRGSNQTLQSLEWQQSVEQADIRHPGTCVTSGSRPEAEQCGTLLAALPQEDAHPEAAQRLILKDGYRKSISCLPT